MVLLDIIVGLIGIYLVLMYVLEYVQIGNKISLILGCFFSLKLYGVVFLIFIFIVKNEVVVIVKENSVFCLRGYYIIFYFGLFVLFKIVVKDN